MAKGKQTCKILKEIRRQIAEANGIEFATSECRYKGDCLGTCPKCEAEVRYLEQQLRTRSLAGKAVALAGISASMLLFSGCNNTSSNQTSDVATQSEPVEQIEVTDTIEDGELPMIEDSISCSTSCSSSDISDIMVTLGEVPYDLPPEPIDPDKIYDVVDQNPQFPGGDDEMQRFISQHLKYPEELLKEGIKTCVVVQFYVDTLGNICEPNIIRAKDPAFNQEALRVVKLFPNFIPGKMNGRVVNAKYTLPIDFKLPAD